MSSTALSTQTQHTTYSNPLRANQTLNPKQGALYEEMKAHTKIHEERKRKEHFAWRQTPIQNDVHNKHQKVNSSRCNPC